MTDEPVQIIDNSQSDRRENRVRIVDPPTEAEERRPKGILKKPTEKFPEDQHAIREGVAPLKDVRECPPVRKEADYTNRVSQATKKGIPPGARWTKIDRRLVNPEALEAAHERFEERLDCVIVLRVLTKEEIQKLADKTREIRGKYHHSHIATPSSSPPPDGASPEQSCVNRASGTDQSQKPASPSTPPHLRSMYRQLSQQKPPPLVNLVNSGARDARTGPEPDRQGGRSDGSGGGRRSNATANFRDDVKQPPLTPSAHFTDKRYDEERTERKNARRTDRNRDRHARDEYEHSESDDEFKEKPPKMLEAPSAAAAAAAEADFIREFQRRQERERDPEPSYLPIPPLGTRDDRRRDDSRPRY
jgi:hypothetical protein